MDILDILLDILLKAPQPFIGLFFSNFPSIRFPTFSLHQFTLQLQCNFMYTPISREHPTIPTVNQLI